MLVTYFLPYHSLLHTIDHMQMYNTHIISCRNTIHLQQASNHLWKWIDWMYIAVNVHSVWTQIMRINSPLMQTVFITGTCLIFEKFFKGIPPSNPRWLWMAQYSLYIYVEENFSTLSKLVKNLSHISKNPFSCPDYLRMLWYPKLATLFACIMVHTTLKKLTK